MCSPRKSVMLGRGLLEDYDMSILYHPVKVIVVVDALRRLSMRCTADFEEEKKGTIKSIHKLVSLEFRLMDSIKGGIVVTNGAESLLASKVKENQEQDPIFLYFKENIHKQRVLTFEQGGDGVLKCQHKLCVPKVDGLQERIMEVYHSSRYSINPGSTKMYCYLRKVYYWEGVKNGLLSLLPNV